VRDTLPWRCRPARPGDEVPVARLFEQVFGRRTSPAERTWKLGRSHGVANVWLGVDAGDRPVCHYAGIPRRLSLASGERDAMVAVDAMTAPAFRRQGLLTAVATRAHEAWRDAGIACVLGLPNEQWGSRTTALCWEPLCELRWTIRPLRPEALMARRTHFPGLARLTAIGAAWNAAWDAGAPSTGGVEIVARDATGPTDAMEPPPGGDTAGARFLLRRDREWLAHRYGDAPDGSYTVVAAREHGQVLGWAACRTRELDGRRVGAIAEFGFPAGRDEVGDRLLSDATRRLRTAGADMAFTLAVPGSVEHRLLRRRGFVFSWGAFDVRVVRLDPTLSIDALRCGGERVLAGGDFDVI
jgi:hypothetical protein